MSSDADAALVAAASAAGYRLTLLDGDTPEAPTPLVVLCGWYGAQDKHLVKYSELVNGLGYHTLRVQMPPATVFSLRMHPRRAFAARLLRFLRTPGLLSPPPHASPDGASSSRAASLPRRPLLYYFFSNGGVFVYEQLSLLLAAHPADNAAAMAAHAGTLFDSSPCYIRPAMAEGLFAHMAPHRALRPLFAGFFRLSIAVLGTLFGRWVDTGDQRATRFWAHLCADPARVPECYLYSADDPLCEVPPLEALQSARCAKGVAVTAKRWEVSAHVGHLRCHPEEYESAVRQFMAGALQAHGRK